MEVSSNESDELHQIQASKVFKISRFRFRSRDRRHKINGIREHGFRWLFHPRWLAAWLPRHSESSIGIPQRVERVHPRIHSTTDYDRFAVIAAIKIIRSSLTINSKLKLLRSRGRLCPRDNVLASLTSTTDTSWSLRAWANYSYHSPRSAIPNPILDNRIVPPSSREKISRRRSWIRFISRGRGILPLR